MKQSMAYDFTVNDKNSTIHIRRDFEAGLDLVWQAWTTADLLDKWCAPGPYRVETKTMDFREGGYWHYALVSPEGKKHWSRYDYKKIEPRKSITELRAFSDENGTVSPDYPCTECVIMFNKAGGKTRVTITEQYGSPEIFEKMATPSHKEGFSSHLKNLDKMLQDLKKQLK